MGCLFNIIFRQGRVGNCVLLSNKPLTVLSSAKTIKGRFLRTTEYWDRYKYFFSHRWLWTFWHVSFTTSNDLIRELQSFWTRIRIHSPPPPGSGSRCISSCNSWVLIVVDSWEFRFLYAASQLALTAWGNFWTSIRVENKLKLDCRILLFM